MTRLCGHKWTDRAGVTHVCGRAVHNDRRHQCDWPPLCPAKDHGRTDGSRGDHGEAVSGVAAERAVSAARPNIASTAAEAGAHRPPAA